MIGSHGMSFALAAIAALPLAAQAGVAFNFPLDGGQEATPNDSDASGMATLEYRPDVGMFDLSLTTQGIALGDLMGVGPNSTPIHIHMAPAGESGPIVIDIGTMSSFVDEGGGMLSFNVTDVPIMGQESALFGGDLYVNIHTSDFPGGEIRGQVVPAPGAAAVAMGGVFALGRRSRRR